MKAESYNKLVKFLKLTADVCAVAGGFYLPIWYWKVKGISLAEGVVNLTEKGEFFLNLVNWDYLFLGVVLSQLLAFGFFRLYEREILFFNFEETQRIVKSVALVWLITLFSGILLGFKLNFVLYFLAPGFIGILFLVLLERYLIYWIVRWNYRRGKWVKKVAIFDVCPTGKLLLKKLFEAPQLGYLPVGFIDNRFKRGKLIATNSDEIKAKVPVLGKVDELKKAVRKTGVEELFIATPSIQNESIRKIAENCKKAGIDYRLIPNLVADPLQRTKFELFGGIPFIKNRELRINFITRFGKRILDILFSILVLVFLSPVFLIIAILIKNDSRGPVIFKQRRVGRDGVPFVMYKFRTMKKRVAKYDYCPTEYNDPRLTRLGRFLRRTSLDELPQFLNVLKGEMSIVGPRPEMGFIVKKYNIYQKERLLVKPGITGIWQLTADRKREIHENMDYDIYYIDNVSIILDVLIIIRTFLFAIRGIGAV